MTSHIVLNLAHRKDLLLTRKFTPHIVLSLAQRKEARSYFSPEKCFQIFWQFGSASVAWVHGDEDAYGLQELDVLAQKVKGGLLVSDGVLDAFHLHGDYRQHLHSNAVELVKAAPGTRLCQTFVDVTHGLKHETTIL